MADTRLVSQRRAARECGLAWEKFRYYVQTGRIPLHGGRVDVDQARAALAVGVADPDQSLRAQQRAGPGVDASSAPAAASGIWDAKAAVERNRAELLALELAAKRREYVKRAEVEMHLAARLIGAREALLAVPDRTVALVRAAASEAEAHALLLDEIRAALRTVLQTPSGEAPGSAEVAP